MYLFTTATRLIVNYSAVGIQRSRLVHSGITSGNEYEIVYEILKVWNWNLEKVKTNLFAALRPKLEQPNVFAFVVGRTVE